MSKAVLQLLAVVGTLEILNAEFVFEYDYDFHFPEGISSKNKLDFHFPEGRSSKNITDFHFPEGRSELDTNLRCGNDLICNPYGKYPCCSKYGWCGNTKGHCSCPRCTDFRVDDWQPLHIDRWSPIKNACIKYNKYRAPVNEVPIDWCKTICIEEIGSVCKSISYELLTHTCQFSELGSNSDAYTEPCYHSNEFVYTEIVKTDEDRETNPGTRFADLKNYIVYWNATFLKIQCPDISVYEGTGINRCKKQCDSTPGCTAFNYFSGKCTLKACGRDPPYPKAQETGEQGYSPKEITKNYTRYDGPHRNYWSTLQGCIHLPPTWRKKSYVECEELCDSKSKCIGFNFNINTFDCDLVFCPDHSINRPTPPEGVVEEGWESWTKRNYKKKTRSYKLLNKAIGYPFIDKHCRLISLLDKKTLSYCRYHCDSLPECKAFSWNHKVKFGCALQNCRRTSPHLHLMVPGDGWQVYATPEFNAITKSHKNLRCGPEFPNPNDHPSQCDPNSIFPCCSIRGWCGNTQNHCNCPGCINYADTARAYEGWIDKLFQERQCPTISLYEAKTPSWCKAECDKTLGCTGFNYLRNKCSLKACRGHPPLPEIIKTGGESYSILNHTSISQYIGPQIKLYFTAQGCIHIQPTRKQKSHVECEEFCDEEFHCIGYNFNLKNFNCDLFYCDDPTTLPQGDVEEGWESWSKVNLIKKNPRSYIMLPGAYRYSYIDRQCRMVGKYDETKGIDHCKLLCDLKPKCTAFNFNPLIGCDLRACGKTPPHPIGKVKGWKGFTLQTNDNAKYPGVNRCDIIGWLSSNNHADCITACKANAGCNHLTYRMNDYDCTLMRCPLNISEPIQSDKGQSTFRIKHKTSGKYIRPEHHHEDPFLNVSSKIDSYNDMRFQMIDAQTGFGYIVHIATNKVVHPYLGSNSPHDFTVLVLHPDRATNALFSHDVVNNRIRHVGGKYIHLDSGTNKDPPDGSFMTLHGDVHPTMEFTFEPIGCRDSFHRCHAVKQFCDTNSGIRDQCKDTCGLCAKVRYSKYYGPYGLSWKYGATLKKGCLEILTLDDATYVECEEKCDQEPWCTGFNYDIDHLRCALIVCWPENQIPSAVSGELLHPVTESWSKEELLNPEPAPKCPSPYKCTKSRIPADNLKSHCDATPFTGLQRCSCRWDPWCYFTCSRCK